MYALVVLTALPLVCVHLLFWLVQDRDEDAGEDESEEVLAAAHASPSSVKDVMITWPVYRKFPSRKRGSR